MNDFAQTLASNEGVGFSTRSGLISSGICRLCQLVLLPAGLLARIRNNSVAKHKMVNLVFFIGVQRVEVVGAFLGLAVVVNLALCAHQSTFHDPRGDRGGTPCSARCRRSACAWRPCPFPPLRVCECWRELHVTLTIRVAARLRLLR